MSSYRLTVESKITIDLSCGKYNIRNILETDPTKTLPQVHTHTELGGYMRLHVTAYTDPFLDQYEDVSHIKAIKESVQGCLFARCCSCPEKQRSTCDGVTLEDFRVESVPPHVRKPIDPTPDPVRVVVQATVFTKRGFDPSHTPCMRGK